MLDLNPDECCKILSVLSDPQRLKIIECLTDGDKNVSELSRCLGKHMVKVSHHLSVLRKAGFVEATREGRFIYYRLKSYFSNGKSNNKPSSFLDLGCCRLELSGNTKKCCI